MRLKNIKKPDKLEKKYKKYFKGVEMEFLIALLEPSPSKRITAKQALMHEYFKELRDNDPDFMVSENASTTQRTLEINRKPSSKYSNNNRFSVYDVTYLNNVLPSQLRSQEEIRNPNKIRNWMRNPTPGPRTGVQAARITYE